MRSWSETIDPATIPDDVLRSEIGRRTSALRVNPSGGRNGGRPALPRCGHCGAKVRGELKKHKCEPA